MLVLAEIKVICWAPICLPRFFLSWLRTWVGKGVFVLSSFKPQMNKCTLLLLSTAVFGGGGDSLAWRGQPQAKLHRPPGGVQASDGWREGLSSSAGEPLGQILRGLSACLSAAGNSDPGFGASCSKGPPAWEQQGQGPGGTQDRKNHCRGGD